jgi:hypothetical protein
VKRLVFNGKQTNLPYLFFLVWLLLHGVLVSYNNIGKQQPNRAWKYISSEASICLDLYQNDIYVTKIRHTYSWLFNRVINWTIPLETTQAVDRITSGVSNIFMYLCSQPWINMTSESFYLISGNQTSIGALYFINPPSTFSVSVDVSHPSNLAIYQNVLEVKVQVPNVLISHPLVLTLYNQSDATGVITMEQMYGSL